MSCHVAANDFFFGFRFRKCHEGKVHAAWMEAHVSSRDCVDSKMSQDRMKSSSVVEPSRESRVIRSEIREVAHAKSFGRSWRHVEGKKEKCASIRSCLFENPDMRMPFRHRPQWQLEERLVVSQMPSRQQCFLASADQ